MRIAEVCVRFGAPGGAEAHVAAIAGGLANLGHEVVVVSSDLETEIPWKRADSFADPPPGVEVVRLPMKVRTFPLRRISMEGLDEALGAIDADVYHAHSHRYHHLRTTASVARRLGKPWCITPHFHPIEENEPAWKHVGGYVMDRLDALRVYRGASRVFTVTDLERKFVRGIARTDSMVTIPNGIDLASWSGPLDPSAFRKAASVDRPYVLYAGRLASNKGLDRLIDAFASIASKHPGVDLVLAGRDWGEGARLATLARARGVADRVRIVGHLDDAAYRSAIAGAELFVLPSEWEAFGIVLVEAMATGRPVVATAVGGVPEVVEDGSEGLLVPFGDAPALASALDCVLADPALARRLGDRGRSKATKYDWPAIARRLEGELLAAIRERTPRPTSW